VRGGLVLIAAGLVAGFVLAYRLNPYKDGKVWYEETHTQLRLPPCTFKWVTGLPCPSCGMTSSFSLLVHGDLWNSLLANAVGTLLALFLMAVIPWNLACAVRGRWVGVRSLESALLRVVLVFFTLLLVRWGLVVLFIHLEGQSLS
jgi:hypothetical protein